MAQTEKINHVTMRGATWCSAAGCFNNKITNPTLSFFRFPKDEERYSDRRKNTSFYYNSIEQFLPYILKLSFKKIIVIFKNCFNIKRSPLQSLKMTHIKQF